MQLDGSRKVPFVIHQEPGKAAGLLPAQSVFQTGPKVRTNLLSVGKLYDGDYDVVISKRMGAYMGRYNDKGVYEKALLDRERNTFGIRVSACSSWKECKTMAKEHGSVCAASGDTKVEEGDPAGDERGPSPGAGPSSGLP